MQSPLSRPALDDPATPDDSPRLRVESDPSGPPRFDDDLGGAA